MKPPSSDNPKCHVAPRSAKNAENMALPLYKTLLFLKRGQFQAQIARQMNTPKKTVNNRIKRLLAIGLIKTDVRSSFKAYTITAEGEHRLSTFKVPTSHHLGGNGTHSRLHRLSIKFPILSDNEQARFDKEVKLNNWIQKFTVVRFPIGITIKKTTKSVIAIFHEFETDSRSALTDFFSHVMRGAYYVHYYTKKELGIDLDIFAGEIIDQHMANEKPELDDAVDGRTTASMDLGRVAKGILPASFKARAWVDRSKGPVEIETNDLSYEEKLLNMPETLHELSANALPVLENLARQIELHLEIQRETLKTLKLLQKKR